MDESIIVTVIGIAITIFFGWVSDQGKKKSDTATAKKPRPTRRVIQVVQHDQQLTSAWADVQKVVLRIDPQENIQPEPTKPTPKPTRPKPTRPTPKTEIIAEPKETPKAKAQPKATLPALDRDGVRNALIWGEILQRKF